MSLREAILDVLSDRKAWRLADIIVAVDRAGVATANDQHEWGGQSNLSHRVRSILAKLKKSGVVKHTGPATYRLA